MIGLHLGNHRGDERCRELGHGIPGGVAVWCGCDQPLLGNGGKSNPNFWAHTY